MKKPDSFITPEKFDRKIKFKHLSGPNGWLLFVDCDNSRESIAKNTRKEYQKHLKSKRSGLKEIPIIKYSDNDKKSPLIKVFEDTETCPTLPIHVAGSNAFVFSSVHESLTENTVNENLMRLYQVIWTLKVNGAKKITVVTPYYPYSRQDKPTFFKREGTLAKMVADIFKIVGTNEMIIYHPHSEVVKGYCEPKIRVTLLHGLDLFLDIFKKLGGSAEVVTVSPDAGGAKFTIHMAKAMGVDYAIANKFRPQKEKTEILGVIGTLENKKAAILTDDETVSFSSLLNAAKSLSEKHAIDEIHIAVSHMKITKENIPKIIEAKKKYKLKELHFTDSVPQTKEVLKLPFVKVHSLSERLALTINSLHYNQSVSRLFYKPKK